MHKVVKSVVLLKEVVPSGEAVALVVDRVDLLKRRWRGMAEDGTRVAVDLERPAKDGEYLAGGGRRFRIEQMPEKVVAIPLPENAEMAAKIAWYLGNRHIPIEVRPEEIVLEEFPTIVDSLEAIGIPYAVREDVLHCKAHSSDHRH